LNSADLSLTQNLDRKAEASRSTYEKSYLEVYGKAAPPVAVRKVKAVAA
jgi:hypothetical protein